MTFIKNCIIFKSLSSCSIEEDTNKTDNYLMPHVTNLIV